MADVKPVHSEADYDVTMAEVEQRRLHQGLGISADVLIRPTRDEAAQAWRAQQDSNLQPLA